MKAKFLFLLLSLPNLFILPHYKIHISDRLTCKLHLISVFHNGICGYGEDGVGVWSQRGSYRNDQSLAWGAAAQSRLTFLPRTLCKSSVRILGNFSEPNGYVLERLWKVNHYVCSDIESMSGDEGSS